MVSLTEQNIAWQQPPPSVPLAVPGEIVDLRPLEAAFGSAMLLVMMKTLVVQRNEAYSQCTDLG
jgi:hypothetical protein